AVHDPALVAFLRTAWDAWSPAGLPSDRVVPYVFARSELTSGREPAVPTAVWARPGLFAYDTMTLIGPGTWEAARAAVDVALTASVHVDPGAGWFPHFLGFAAENDDGNLNLPLAPGTGNDGWLAAVREAAAFAAPARAFVVALGVDAAAGDPESPLEVTAEGYREAGRILGDLGLPTVVVQEGGYDLATIGPLVVET